MAELADALDLGSSGRPCRFKSCYPHWKRLFVMIHEEPFLLHKTGKRMDACIQIHLPVVRTWSMKCGMFVCEIE